MAAVTPGRPRTEDHDLVLGCCLGHLRPPLRCAAVRFDHAANPPTTSSGADQGVGRPHAVPEGVDVEHTDRPRWREAAREDEPHGRHEDPEHDGACREKKRADGAVVDRPHDIFDGLCDLGGPLRSARPAADRPDGRTGSCVGTPGRRGPGPT